MDISENVEYTYLNLKDYVLSEDVDIYTLTSIIVKNYGQTNFIRYVLISIMCFIVQTTIPIFVLFDIFYVMLDSEANIEWCSGKGTWTDKASSSIMCMFLLFFYITRWNEYISQFYKDKKSIILLKNLELYVSEIFFTCGFIANILSHCINTIAGLIILYQTIGTLDIVINCCVLYYFSDISSVFVTKKIKDKCLYLLENKHKQLIENIDQSTNELKHENVTYKKIFDSYVGISAIIFMIIIFPILGISTIISLLGGIIFMAVCHP